MSATVCNHGYWLSHCAKCQKHAGECDYGDCQSMGDRLIEYHGPITACEIRRACDKHAPIMLNQTGAALEIPQR